VAGLVREGEKRFRAAGLEYGHGTFNARDEAAFLALHALDLPVDAPARTFEKPLSPAAARRIRELFDRRIRGRKPSAYLTREAWLGDFPFYVDERVIVPRSHIADLLRENLAPWITTPRRVATVLDLCTGSGCLAVLAAHSFPRARIDATDISTAALAVARINVRNYGLGRRIRLLKSDGFSALKGKRYDLIVCNPPYVTISVMRKLPREYRHEPQIALAGGHDGLDLVRKILLKAADHLRPDGLLVMEVGDGRARVERAFPGVEFTWPETPGGGDVLAVRREQLPAAALRGRATRAAAGLRAAPIRRTARA
jgi:ribosomal protein L3 glutamine methyltransferase